MRKPEIHIGDSGLIVLCLSAFWTDDFRQYSQYPATFADDAEATYH